MAKVLALETPGNRYWINFVFDIPISVTTQYRLFIEDLSRSLSDINGGITSYRTSVLWPLFLREINHSPSTFFFGHGWASEELFMGIQRQINPLIAMTNVGTAHNGYLGLTYQIGLLGSAVTFGSLWFIVLRTVLDNLKQVKKERYQFRVAVVGAVLVALCISIFETGIYNMGAFWTVPTWMFVYLAVRERAL